MQSLQYIAGLSVIILFRNLAKVVYMQCKSFLLPIQTVLQLATHALPNNIMCLCVASMFEWLAWFALKLLFSITSCCNLFVGKGLLRRLCNMLCRETTYQEQTILGGILYYTNQGVLLCGWWRKGLLLVLIPSASPTMSEDDHHYIFV